MQNENSIKKNVLYNTLLSISQFIFPLVTFPYVSRILGPAGIGEVSFVDSMTQYFILFAALGIPVYGVREIAKRKNDQEGLTKLYAELISIHFFLTLILSLVYIALFNFIPKLHTKAGLFWIGTAVLIINVFPAEWFFQGIEQFSYIVKRTLIIRILSVGLIFLMIRSPEDSLWYYSINFITFLLNSVINISYILRHLKIKFSGLELKHHLKPLLLIFSGNVAISVYILMDSIILGLMGSNAEVGYYTTCVRFNRLSLSLLSAFSLVMLPRLSVAFNNRDNDKARSLLKESFEYIMFLSIPICVGVYVLAPDIIYLFAGSAFDPSITVLRITSPLIVFIGLSNIFGMQMLIPTGKEMILLKAVSIGTVMSIILNLVLIPIYKHNGTAVTSVLTELTVTLLTGYFALREFRFNMSSRIIIYAIIASLTFFPIASLISLWQLNPYMRFISIVAFSGLSYFSVQYFVFRNHLVVKILSIGKTYLKNKF